MEDLKNEETCVHVRGHGGLGCAAWADGDAEAVRRSSQVQDLPRKREGREPRRPDTEGCCRPQDRFGRGFKYSDAMAKKGADGQVWDEPTLTTYLKDPKAMVPGTKMAFPASRMMPKSPRHCLPEGPSLTG